MMQAGHTYEHTPTHPQTEGNLKIEEYIALHSQKRQGAGISEQLRRCLSRIEDTIFQQANQISTILQGQQSIKVDGYAYSTILQSSQLHMLLQKVRMNAPIYQNMSSKKKKKFFQKLGTDYCLSLSNKKIDNDEQKPYLCNEETHQISQNSIIKDRKFGKKIKKSSVSKVSLISEIDQSFEEAEVIIEPVQFKTPKKVCFFTESSKKYFAKQESVASVSIERTYLFSTLDRL